MKKALTFNIVYLLFLVCCSQEIIDFNNYTPLVCKGTITEDFKIELSELVEKEKQSNGNKNDKAQAVTFSEISNYQLNNMLFSGRVLYGDVLTDYVNKVADVILKDDKELRDELRFYVLKSTNLNAYSTHRGVIFISMGLLAQIESEAQLAFIMCHEIVHYKNRHGLETFKNRQKVFSDRKNMNVNKRISSILNYSKENELEADGEGLDLFLKTPYGTNELNNLFDVMLYSYLPFDEINFDTLYFNSSKDYVMPTKYFLSDMADITAEEDVVDSLSTHPNIKKRREKIQFLLKTKGNKSGASFVNGEAKFKNIQKISRHELAIIYLQDVELEQAIYTGYLIEKVYGKTMFSDKIISGALYVKSKQKIHNREDNYYIENYDSENDNEDSKWEKIEGESQAVYYFLHMIPAKELCILASNRLLEGHKLYNDVFFSDRFKSVVHDLVDEFELKSTDFVEAYKLKVDSTSSVNQDDTETVNVKTSKVSKIKKSKATQAVRNGKRKDNKYYQYAFEENYRDSLLKESFRKSESQYNEKQNSVASGSYKKYRRKRFRIIKKYGQGLGIDKMVLINPFFSSYIIKENDYENYRVKDPNVTPLEEVAVEHNLLKYVLEYANDLDLNLDVVGSTQQSAIETEKFNDFQQLINWLSERIAIGKMGTYSYTDQYNQDYIEDYGHLGFCQVVKYEHSLEFTFVLLNLETGKIDFIYEKRFRKGQPDGILVKMMLYDAIQQIKQDAKKINRLKKRYHIDE